MSGSHLTPDERTLVLEALLVLYHYMQDVATVMEKTEPPWRVRQAFMSTTSSYIDSVDDLSRRLNQEDADEKG